MMTIEQTARLARRASRELAACSSERKNAALTAVRDALRARAEAIIGANQQDIEQAKRNHLSQPLLKRLKFDEAKLNEACAGLDSLIGLGDPVGKTLATTELDAGLELYKVSCPIGVIGVIFESRPDALVQISSLCLKSGNAVLLKGGSEAAQTNRILAETITQAAASAG
ncbi:MAG: gamma-glutamyl-phosphate reductase, partial [Planctomycetes bacterium]|nr:gamma-glutamyl-phosphate reductase [Planctomycetota bacterium]